jgi:POT family proton-dependent oligopeptide transporter
MSAVATASLRVPDDPMLDRSFFGHPKGLSTLFFTEMWERFSYYGMRALLILFMTAPVASGGLGFDTAPAGAIYGLYTSMVYMTSLPGGWIADRLIGQRRAVLYGGILIACGHFSMAVPSLSMFYAGLTLIVIGTGLLKGNAAVIVGRLYAPDDVRRDAGFSIYYMGINLGAFIAPLVCGYLGQRVNWHAGFVMAGFGMVLGVIQYVMGSRHLGDAGLEAAPAGSPAETARVKARARMTLGVGLVALFGLGLGISTGILPISARQAADLAGYLLLGVTIAFFVWLFLAANWTREERSRLLALGVLFVAAALFWSEFEQSGSTLNLFGDRATRTSFLGFGFPSSYFQALQPLFIIIFAGVFAWIWLRLGRQNPSSPTKFAMGLVLVGAGFGVLAIASTYAASGIKVAPYWLVATYLLHTFGELCLSPVGLSAMTRLAPARVAGMMLGAWYLATSWGSFIGGRLASLYGSMPLPDLFGAIAAFGVGAGLVMFVLARPIRRLMGEVH